VLAHVVPPPELTETGPYDAADLELHQRVIERNKRTAETYLERMRRNIGDLGVRVRVISTQGRDVRATLHALIKTEAIDLVVLSSRGHGLSANAEMPYGSVSGYLMTHSPTPLLVVPTATDQARSVPNGRSYEVRMPLIASA
jgi:nucleotide-binding universal stress UspA family protein